MSSDNNNYRNPPVEYRFTSDNQPENRGRKPGQRPLSVIIRDLLENEIDWDLVTVDNAKELGEKYKNRSAWEALVITAFSQGMRGNTKAMDWLSKSGYGNKVDVTSGDKPIVQPQILSIVAPRNTEESE